MDFNEDIGGSSCLHWLNILQYLPGYYQGHVTFMRSLSQVMAQGLGLARLSQGLCFTAYVCPATFPEELNNS